MSATKPMPVVILEWRPMRRNSLLGFASIQLGALKIKDITVNINTGRKWAGLPGKPMTDKEGNAMRNEQGKVRYVSLMEWDTKGAADRFSESVIVALEEKFPGSTGE